MAWEGYWEFAGQELINTKRTQAYAEVAGLSWFKPVYDDADFVDFMSITYTSPAIDDAPWFDPNDPGSYDFFGFYPLSITGVEDSTITADIRESTLDGGTVGRARQATKEMVFSGLLVARSQCGAEFGQRWLRALLNEQPCFSNGSCGGEELCFLSCSPSYKPFCGPTPGDPPPGFEGYSRSYRNVSVVRGPIVNQKSVMTDKAEVWSVDFTAVAADPTMYGDQQRIITGLLMNAPDHNPWVIGDGTPPDGYSADEVGFTFNDVICPKPVYTPVFDPLCPAVIPPPLVPSLTLGCSNVPTTWTRRLITIPATAFPIWSDRALVMEFNAQWDSVRNLRIRMYTDTGAGITDQCSPCGDALVSYIPEGASLMFDMAQRQVFVTTPGGVRRRADSLVFSSEGGPLDWPEITCGAGLIVAVDMPVGQTPPWIELGIRSRY